MPLVFTPGHGPSLPEPIRSPADLARLRSGTDAAADLGYVGEAIRRTVAGLPGDIPCIGFCGAPFTLASYAIEGGGSRTFTRTKAFMYQEPAAWNALLERLVDALIPYLHSQVEAGATALQIFDSWGGELSPADYGDFVLPHLRRLVSGLPSTVPVIVFGTRTAHLLADFGATGADVVGCDQMIPLSEAWDRAGGPGRVAIQGNLDPALLLGDRRRLLAQARSVLEQASGRPGHIFNLGHGIIKETDPDMAKALVDFVHQTSAGHSRASSDL